MKVRSLQLKLKKKLWNKFDRNRMESAQFVGHFVKGVENITAVSESLPEHHLVTIRSNWTFRFAEWTEAHFYRKPIFSDLVNFHVEGDVNKPSGAWKIHMSKRINRYIPNEWLFGGIFWIGCIIDEFLFES